MCSSATQPRTGHSGEIQTSPQLASMTFTDPPLPSDDDVFVVGVGFVVTLVPLTAPV
jgi:hypothetical protein